MAFQEIDQDLAPMSPTAQYLKSSALSLTVLAVLEAEFPINDSFAITLLRDTFLPINPRFSSIMVTTGRKGVKKWKRVEVNLNEHVNVPIFPDDMSVDYYDQCFTDYLSKIAMEQFPPNRPLWEIHIVKYPTKNAAGNVILKLHHSLGDGFSLMGALFSCLQRIDDPLMPLTFPTRHLEERRSRLFLKSVPRFFTGIYHTVSEFSWSLLKSTVNEDDKTPVRSAEKGVEFKPVITCTTSFSIDQLREIKNRLKVTINDVLTGVIFFGTRLYMQKASSDSSVGKAKSTALVLLNTRAIGGYKSVAEMIKPDANIWGNRFAFLPVSVPKLTESELQNPLKFVEVARKTIKRQRNSASVLLTGQLLNLTRKLRGPEVTARYIHGTLKNTSLAISNLIGPVEKMSLSNQPVKGLYFVVAGPPQSLSVTVLSYVDKLRVAITVEKGFVHHHKLKSSIEYAFEAIYKSALESTAAAATK